jgi:hypothetical protein
LRYGRLTGFLVLVILKTVDDIFWRDKERETLKELPLSYIM